jgi:hypothetical protein
MPASRQIVLLVILCAGVLQANGRAHPQCDTMAAPYTAWSLIRHGSLDLRSYRSLDKYPTHVHTTQDGTRVSIRPIGDALFMLPFVLPSAIVLDEPPSDDTLQFLGKIAGTSAVIGSAILFFLTCRRLVPSAAFPASLLLVLGTCLASVASQAIWNHGPSVFWVSGALFLLTHEPFRGRMLLAGLVLGLATISRSTAAFFAVASGLALLSQWRWRDAIALTAGGMIPVGIQALLNLHFFGNAISGGYENQFNGDAPPWWLGMGGLLIAPSRGLLIYSPAVLLVPAGIWALCQRTDPETRAVRPLVLGWFAAAIGTVIFYGRWWCWFGGTCYGPRFLIECMPIVCLLFAYAYEASSTLGRVVAGVLVVLSIAVHVIGLYGHNEEMHWHVRHPEDNHSISMFDLNDMQIEAYADNIYRKVTGKKRYDHSPLGPK